jgi:hypothetical protein
VVLRSASGTCRRMPSCYTKLTASCAPHTALLEKCELAETGKSVTPPTPRIGSRRLWRFVAWIGPIKSFQAPEVDCIEWTMQARPVRRVLDPAPLLITYPSHFIPSRSPVAFRSRGPKKYAACPRQCHAVMRSFARLGSFPLFLTPRIRIPAANRSDTHPARHRASRWAQLSSRAKTEQPRLSIPTPPTSHEDTQPARHLRSRRPFQTDFITA